MSSARGRPPFQARDQAFGLRHRGSGAARCAASGRTPLTARARPAQAVFTAQLYLLPNDKKSISTDGVEGNGKAVRSLTGGTGFFRGYVGEQRQEFLGFNASGGVNLRVTFILKKAAR